MQFMLGTYLDAGWLFFSNMTLSAGLLIGAVALLSIAAIYFTVRFFKKKPSDQPAPDVKPDQELKDLSSQQATNQMNAPANTNNITKTLAETAVVPPTPAPTQNGQGVVMQTPAASNALGFSPTLSPSEINIDNLFVPNTPSTPATSTASSSGQEVNGKARTTKGKNKTPGKNRFSMPGATGSTVQEAANDQSDELLISTIFSSTGLGSK